MPYDLRVMPFPPRERQPGYLALNPLGTIPGFSDGDVWMTESVAICEYLVARYGPTPLGVEPGEGAFGAYLNWLHFGEATLTFPQTIVLRYSRFEPAGRQLPQAASDYTRWFLSRLRAVTQAVSSAEFLCAGRFTAADISVGYALLLAEDIGLATRFSAEVQAYWGRLKSRSAFVRASAREAADALGQGVSPVAAAKAAD